MATKRTFIGADEELVVKGKLVVEGNITQQETTQTVNNLESDQFVINSDSENTTAVLTLNSNGTLANLSYTDGGNIVFSKTIQGNVYVTSGGSITIDGGLTLSGNVLSGNVAGTANFANALSTARNFSITGSDGTASAQSFDGTGDVGLPFALTTTGVSSGTYGTSNDVAQITIDSKGRISSASDVAIDHDALANFVANEHIDHTSVSILQGAGLSGANGDITASRTITVGQGTGIVVNASNVAVNDSHIRSLVSVTDSGGDGSLAYNNGTGEITYTGPSASEVRAHFSAGTGIDISSGTVSTNDSEIVISALSGYDANRFIDHTGVSISAGNGLTGGGTIATTRSLHVGAGDGIDVNANDVAVDSTVIRTTGSQTISGDKTFTGNVDLSGAGTIAGFTVDGDFAVSGNIQATGNLNTVNQVDLVVDNANIHLNNGNSAQDSHIIIDRPGATGSDTYVKWNETSDRWQFSNDGSTDYNMLLFSDFSGSTGITFSSGAISITNSGVSAATYGSATAVPQVAVNAQGQITSASDLTIAIPHSQITDFDAASNDAMDAYLTGGTGIDITSGTVAIDSTVIQTTGTQTISGDKTFSGKLIIPTSAATSNGSIYYDNANSKVFAYVAGAVVELSPAVDAGEVEDVGGGDIDVYAGNRSSGNTTIHGIKSISSGTYASISESSNVITIDASISAIRGGFSATGDLSYNATSGAFSFSQRTDSQIRGLVSGTGLVSYDNSTGVISTTADNYSSWLYTTESAGNESVSSGELITFSGGAGIDVTHSGSTITITQNSDVGDITSVVAGTGLSGGGTSGDVTLNVSGLTVSELAPGSLQTSGESFSNDDTSLMTSAAIEDKILSYGYTTQVGDITGVTAGTGLTGGGTSGTVTLNIGQGYGISANADDIEIANSEVRALFSAGGDLSYNASTGVFSFTNDAGDIEGVTAGNGLSGGGTSGTVSLALDLNELSAAVVDVASDSIAIIDANDSNVSKKESIADLASAMAGTGITATNGVLSASVGDITGVTAGTNLNGGGSSGAVTLNLDTTLTGMTAATFSGNVNASYFVGTATQAQYADLAEKYIPDADYEPGTVLIIGGNEEVTVTDEPGSYQVIGVVSTEPAYLMNSDADGVAIALRGRIPCKVCGVVKKGDVLITSNTPGHAMVAADPQNLSPLQIVGRALSNKTEAAPGIVEIIV